MENRRIELLQYVQARGWTVYREYADEGVSGGKDRRPALDQLVVALIRFSGWFP